MDRFAQMERIKHGDQDAFREIFTEYRMPVYRFALDQTNDAQKAKDIVKYVFSTVYDTLQQEPYYGDFSAWFQTLAELKLSEMQIMEAHREKQEHTAAKAKRKKREAPSAVQPAAEQGKAPSDAVGDAEQDVSALPKAKVPVGSVIVQVLFILLRIAAMAGLIWMILGLLRAMHVLTIPDWGFTWFNTSVFELF